MMASLKRFLCGFSWFFGIALAVYNLHVFMISCLVLWSMYALIKWAETEDVRGPLASPPDHEAYESTDTDLNNVCDSKPTPSRSVSVPKDYKQTLGTDEVVSAPRSPGLYKKHATPEQVAKGLKKHGAFDPRAATRERRKRLKTMSRGSRSWSDGIDAVGDSIQGILERNSSVRRSCKGSKSGSCGDLTEGRAAEEEMEEGEGKDGHTALPNFKIWSSCGNLHRQFIKEKHLKDSRDFVDSWDGLHQILVENKAFAKPPTETEGDENASKSGSTINLVYHWGPIVHMDNSSEVQIGNNNVLKVDKQAEGTPGPSATTTAGRGGLVNGAAPAELATDDLAVDGEEDDVTDITQYDVSYEVVEDTSDVHDLNNQAVEMREKATSYHSPSTAEASTGQDTSELCAPELQERGTSYHDPTEEEEMTSSSDYRDMATGTTMSLMRGIRFEDYYREVATLPEGQGNTVVKEMDTEWRCMVPVDKDAAMQDDAVFCASHSGSEEGDDHHERTKFTYEGERAKIFEQMQNYRQLISNDQKRKRKGIFNRIKRKIST